MTCQQSRIHVFSDTLPLRCDMEANTCHPQLAAAGCGLISVHLGRTRSSFPVGSNTKSEQRDIRVKGQSWRRGQVCFLGMSMTPCHSLPPVCACWSLASGSWKGKATLPSTASLVAAVRRAAHIPSNWAAPVFSGSFLEVKPVLATEQMLRTKAGGAVRIVGLWKFISQKTCFQV